MDDHERQRLADLSIEALILHDKMEKQADYLRRGRKHANVDSAELSRRWVEAFRRGIRSNGRDGLAEAVDFESELLLRGVEPPVGEITKDLEAWRATLKPEDKNSPGVRDAIRGFLEARDKPVN